MSVPTTSWSEITPAGSDQINAGDNRIRELKTQIREVIDVDHDFPSSGQAADVGQHKRVTLQEQADLGSGAVGTTILGSQTVTGKGELVYTDEDDNDVQITTGGKIKAENLAGVYPAANVAALATMMNLIYPVGSIYMNKTVSTNPGTLLGVGTWTAIEGYVVAGYKLGDANFGTAGVTVGAATVDASHTHTLPRDGWGQSYAGYANGRLLTGSAVQPQDGSAANDNTSVSGGSATQSTIQPTLVAYCWVRTA
jgi:hypothetical protein